MRYSSRFFLYGPFGLFVALALATMIYWWIDANTFSRQLDRWNGHAIAPGIHFSYARRLIGGFPFRVDTQLDGLRIEIATSHGPAVWTTEHFALHALTYGRTQFVFEAAGKQTFNWHDDRGGVHAYQFLPGSFRASAIADGNKLVRFDVDLIDAASPDVSATQVQIHLRKDPARDALDLAVSADDVHIDPELGPAFGPDIKHLAVDSIISRSSSFDALLSGHGDWRKAVELARSRNGGVSIDKFAMVWGKLNAAGSGEMTVDSVHRPLGILKLKIDGWQPLERWALQQGWPKGADQGLAPGFFAFAADAANSPNAPLAATIGFKDGIVYFGSVPSDFLSPLY